MNWIFDGLIFCFILLLAIRGYQKGFIEEFGQIIGLIISSLISISQSYRLADIFLNYSQFDLWVCNIFSFVFIFSISLIVIRILIKTVQIIFLSNNNQWMNKFLGIIFGAIKGFSIIIIFIWFITLLPLVKWNSFIEKNSRFALISNQIKLNIVSAFNWDDLTIRTESYFKNITQP